MLAEVRISHLDRQYFVTMGTYQMAILLAFNDHRELTLADIEEATKLNVKELEKQVVSLIDAKFLIGDTVSFGNKISRIRHESVSSSRTICHRVQLFPLIPTTEVNEQNLKFLLLLRKRLVT